MRRIIGILFAIADLIMIPISLVYYILLTMDLFYGCAIGEGRFDKEYADFNRIVIKIIKVRIKTHRDRILRG